MKKTIYLLLLLSFNMVSAQVPNMFSYRSVVTDSDNRPIQNEEVTVQIRIQDSETNGAKSLYYEVHNLTTNTNGAFSLQIGNGKPQDDFKNLDDVDWAEGDHFINVIVLNNKNERVSKGTTQLMSVPYALLAKAVIDNDPTTTDLDCFDNIDALRAYSVPNVECLNANNQTNINNPASSTDDDGPLITACISGHTDFKDGGEGFFYFVPCLVLDDDDGIIIRPDNVGVNEKGRWVRQIDGYININYYGVKGGWQYFNPNNTINIADQIQRAIDYAASNTRFDHNYNPGIDPIPLSEFTKGNTVFFPNGEYFLDKPLTINNGVHILGEQNTQLTAISNFDYFFKIGEGPIQIDIEHIILNGNDQPSIGGMHFEAQAGGASNSGGLWRSNFKDINITNIYGDGLYFEGIVNIPNDTTSFNGPNQFNIFQNVNIKRKNDAKSNLKATGQIGQLTFINCAFDGDKPNIAGANVHLESSGGVVTFLNCSIQGSEYGIRMIGSQNITIDNCWFENLKVAIDVTNSSKSINILNSRFANACGYGSEKASNGGRCISSTDSSINIERNYVLVTEENGKELGANFIRGFGNNNTINATNNSFKYSSLSKTYGILQSVILDNNTSSEIITDGKKLVFINISGAQELNRIDSTVSAGETIFIRANGGSININHISGITGSNIFIPGGQTVSLNNGQSARFMKIDNFVNSEPATYQLISVY